MDTQNILKEVDKKLHDVEMKFFSNFPKRSKDQKRNWLHFCERNNIKNTSLENTKITIPINKEFNMKGIECKLLNLEIEVMDEMRILKSEIQGSKN